MIDVGWLEGLLALTVQVGVLYLLASLGEIYAERSGVLNLGLEGIMIIGAVTSFVFTNALGHGYAVLAAATFGCGMGLLLALLTVTMKLNQIVVGLAMTIMGYGVSGLMGHPSTREHVMRALNPGIPQEVAMLQRAPPLGAITIPGLSELPLVGRAFFSHNILVYLALVLAFVMWFVLFRTSFGLSVRSVGENPSMADALGVNVFRLRYLTCVVSGLFGGLAGAYLFIGYQPFWLEMMTNGRGFIALSLVILASWNPLRAILGSLLFGGVEVIQYRLQLFGVGAQTPQFVLMLPYIVAIVTLSLLSIESVRKRIGVPEALGKPYSRE
ncbi:MAG: ABC transporter permease [Thaumarchaeota archaeon]|nr:ABC transporter permease [Candidatus Calditenuaceae archaeon]MDW8186971.1 ABC transporter permease [Nitrososphaerota archaeon]